MLSRVQPSHCLTLLLGVALLLTSGTLPARDDRDWYDVEVIIFRQFDGGNVRSSERWPAAPGAATFQRYAQVSNQAPGNSDTHFRLNQESAMGLRDSARSLRNSNAFEVLLHASWRQPGMPGETAPAVAVPLSAPTSPARMRQGLEPGSGNQAAVPAGLSGHVRLVRERFLHFEVDLRYREENTSSGNDALMRGSGSGFSTDGRPVIVMQERRRMRSRELHYLDNPRLGVMVIATPVENR